MLNRIAGPFIFGVAAGAMVGGNWVYSASAPSSQAERPELANVMITTSVAVYAVMNLPTVTFALAQEPEDTVQGERPSPEHMSGGSAKFV